MLQIREAISLVVFNCGNLCSIIALGLEAVHIALSENPQPIGQVSKPPSRSNLVEI